MRPTTTSKVVPKPKPESFEALRQYISAACDQLLKDLKSQRVAYAVPADNVLSLIERTAHLRRESPWAVWESWALRHAIPVDDIVRQLASGVYDPRMLESLERRLRDLLGYCVLGLVMCEKKRVNR